MGDYTNTGIKIGTCGVGYYATRKMLENYHSHDSEVNYYLKPENKCWFAFPFPQWDNKKVGEITIFHIGDENNVDWRFRLPEDDRHNCCKKEFRLMYQHYTEIDIDGEIGMVLEVECTECQKRLMLDYYDIDYIEKQLDDAQEESSIIESKLDPLDAEIIFRMRMTYLERFDLNLDTRELLYSMHKGLVKYRPEQIRELLTNELIDNGSIPDFFKNIMTFSLNNVEWDKLELIFFTYYSKINQ